VDLELTWWQSAKPILWNITYGMHNQHIDADIKEIGNGSYSLLSNERNPFYYTISIKTNIAHLILTIAGHGSAVGTHHPNVTTPTIVANDMILLRAHGWIKLLQTVLPTLAIRVPQHVLTTCRATGVARSTVPSVS